MDIDPMYYGPNSNYMIDASKSYTVQTKFWTDQNADDLLKITTTLFQGDNEVVLEQDCQDYLEPLRNRLDKGVAMAISQWEMGSHNDIS